MTYKNSYLFYSFYYYYYYYYYYCSTAAKLESLTYVCTFWYFLYLH